MSSGLYVWSQTAASNSNADSAINWAEGQAPSSVNDSARAMMAAIAKFRDDTAGSIVTGGTSTAFTVTSNQNFDTLAHLHNQMIAFVPNATSTNAIGADVTLNVDGLGAKPIRSAPSITLPTGSLVLGTPYLVTYNNSDGVFYLQGSNNHFHIPLAAGMDYWAATAPNSCFAFPAGQAISRTTYANLFSLVGTTYGTGDGSTTFNLPDKTGRVSAMKESVATRLTSAISGVDGATLGAAGAAQNKTIAQANLPNVNFTVNFGTITTTLTNSLGGSVLSWNNSSGSVTAGGVISGPSSTVALGTVTGATTIGASTAASGGSGTALPVVQPTIVCNYIIRIL